MRRKRKKGDWRVLVTGMLTAMALLPEDIQQPVIIALWVLWFLWSGLCFLSNARTNQRHSADEKSDERNILAREIKSRIDEQIKKQFPNAKWTADNKTLVLLATKGRPFCTACSNTGKYSHVNVTMNKQGKINIQMFDLVDLSDTKTDFDLNKWFADGGQETLTRLITDINSKGYKRLTIDLNGDVTVTDKGKAVYADSVELPPKSEWHSLSKLMSKLDIKTAIANDSISFGW